MRPIKKGSTDQSVVIRIIDAADGTPETAVEHDTAGIDLWYRREGATKTSLTEAALASLDAAHADGGIEHIGDGYYRVDLPDAAVAAGVTGVMVGGTVPDMIVVGCYVPLVDELSGQLADDAIDDAAFAADTDVYDARVWLQDKNSATATDLYTVIFCKNGVPITTGVTVPKIQVIKRADGTDLVAETALTEIGALGLFKHDETTNLMVPGASYVIKITFTAGGSSRTTYWTQGRDVAA